MIGHQITDTLEPSQTLLKGELTRLFSKGTKSQRRQVSKVFLDSTSSARNNNEIITMATCNQLKKKVYFCLVTPLSKKVRCVIIIEAVLDVSYDFDFKS